MSRFLHRAAVALAAVAVAASISSPASAARLPVKETTDWTAETMCQGDTLTFRTTKVGVHNFTVTNSLGVIVAISPPTTKDAPAAVPVVGSQALQPGTYGTSDTFGSAGFGSLTVNTPSGSCALA